MKNLINRLKNTGTIVSLISMIVLLLTTNGIVVDDNRIMVSVKVICSILVLLGVMNNAETPGMYIPLINEPTTPKKIDPTNITNKI